MSPGQGIAAAVEALAGLVARAGMPLAVLSWLSLLAGAIWMHRRLRDAPIAPHRAVAGAVGGIALAAHLTDFITTITVTPRLLLETSPLWVVVIEHLGYQAALLYGLTGKALIVILSYQLFLWYRIQRIHLFPPPGQGSLLPFIRAFGSTHLSNLGNFFAFAFPLLSPLMFYVVLLNSTESFSVLARLPSLPVVVAAWMALLPLAYFQASHRAWMTQ